MKTTSIIYFLYVGLLFSCNFEEKKIEGEYSSANYVSSGLEDIDHIRKNISISPTDSINFEERRASLLRWWRLFWRQGIDLHSFDTIANQLVNDVVKRKQNYAAIDLGYLILEKILKNPQKIPEIESNEKLSSTSSKTNWPFFFGTTANQRGYSPDAGPTKGKIAWKYPKGYYWNAPPIIENGKIYTSTPGIDVIGFCLDEKTGKVIWRGKQNGIRFYAEHSSRWPAIVSEKHVTIRGGYDSTSIKILDKKTGALLLNQDSVTDKAQKLMTYIRDGKTLVLANAHTGGDIWVYSAESYFSGEPKLDDKYIFTTLRNGEVIAFEISNNKPIWQIDLKENTASTPSVIGSEIYIGTKAKKLYSLNKLNGTINWVFETDQEENKSNQFFTEVEKHNNRLYVGAANKEIYCLNALNGSLVWKNKLSDWIRSKPFILNDILYIATLDSKLYAFENLEKEPQKKFLIQLGQHGITANITGSENGILAIGKDLMMYSVHPKTGAIQWSRGIVDGAWIDNTYYFADWNGGLLGSPTVVDDIVYIGGPDGFVNAVDSETGKELWRFETNSTTSIAPTVAEGKVYFGYLGATSEHYGFDNPGEYFALDKDTGEPVWTSTHYGRVWVGAAYKNGVLFIGNTDGHVFGVNPENGEQLWTYWTGKNTSKAHIPKNTPFKHGFPMGVYCVPTSDDKNFYTGSWSGYYFAFDQKTGNVVWRCETKASDWGGLPDSAAPTIWNGHMYVQKKGGMLAAIDLKTGKAIWEWNAPQGHLYNATPAVNDGIVYGSVVRQVVLLPYTGKMLAFNDVEGGSNIVWEQDNIGGLTAPVLTDQQLISGSSYNMFFSSHNPKTGEVNWRIFTGGEMLENVPAIYGDKAFALCKNGYLFAFE